MRRRGQRQNVAMQRLQGCAVECLDGVERHPRVQFENASFEFGDLRFGAVGGEIVDTVPNL